MSRRSYNHKRITFYHGDARTYVSRIPTDTALIFTDPPYGMKLYTDFWGSKPQIVQGDHDLDGALSLFQEIGSSILDRCTREHLPFLVWTNWTLQCVWRKALEDIGLQVKNAIIWHKPNHSIGDTYGRFASKYEIILYATRGRPAVRPRIADVQKGKIVHQTKHPTPKPINLIGKLIRSLTKPNDIVADPFMGSGSTMIAAHRVGRTFWGCELDEQYIQECVHQANTITSELFSPTVWE